MNLIITLISRALSAVATELITRTRSTLEERYGMDKRVASLVVLACSLGASYAIRIIERIVLRTLERAMDHD